jgi:hypothetical protein
VFVCVCRERERVMHTSNSKATDLESLDELVMAVNPLAPNLKSLDCFCSAARLSGCLMIIRQSKNSFKKKG